MSVSNRLLKQSNRLPKYRPLPWNLYLRGLLAKDPVLWVSGALAILSCVVVRPPLRAYADFIEYKTLACLACLMTASGGFLIAGLFDIAAERLVVLCRTARALTAAMVFGAFFSSMLITNDVALIVLVPVALAAFKRAGLDPASAVVLMTIAANTGSILLPMGNPQNLYLYSRYGMAFRPFLLAVLPLAAAGFALLALFCLRAGTTPVRAAAAIRPRAVPARSVFASSLLFLLSVLAVLGAFDYRAALALALAAVLLSGRFLAQQIDFALLLTFVFFFIFTGNIAGIPAIGEALSAAVAPRPFLAAAAASQIISNVPAAVLLSRFTEDGFALLAGVSAGGFGTPVASMASLISYKLYTRDGGERGRYLLLFSALNILFLAATAAAHALCARAGEP